MSSDIKSAFKEVIPPVLWRAFRSFIRRPLWSGDYDHWEDAAQKCKGYHDEQLVPKLIAATREVVSGRAAFERDTVLFHEEQVNFPLAASLLHASKNRSGVRVVDLGGAMGSAYWQNRRWIDSSILKWIVVEQSQIVNSAKEFEDGKLSFSESLENAVKGSGTDVFFSSSALQYLPDPFEVIKKVIALEFDWIILDRIALDLSGRSRITVQRVPREIAAMSYPCRFFSESELLGLFKSNYDLVWEWSCFDTADLPSEFKGYFMRKKPK